MSKELPPELRPQLAPPSRAATLVRVREGLDDLARADCDDDFLLLRVHSDGMIESHGVTGGVKVCKQLVAMMLFDMQTIAEREGDPTTTTLAALMLAMLGVRTEHGWGGIRSVMGPRKP